MKKFEDSDLGLTILIIVSLVAGLSLLISPESTPLFVIRMVGILWIIDGIGFILKIIIKKNSK